MKKTILGLIVILIGVILLGNSFNVWDINLFFKGWWTLFIIIPSCIGLLDKDNCVNSLLSLLVGVLLLLACQDIITWSMIGKIFLPVFIIVVGLLIIFAGSKTNRSSKENRREYVAIFGGVEETISEVNTDFSITSIFGDVELDLRDAKIKEDIVIDCVSIFGGIDLKLPRGVNVVSSGVPIFGGLENKTNNKNENKVTVTINYVSIFGGVDLI